MTKTTFLTLGIFLFLVLSPTLSAQEKHELTDLIVLKNGKEVKCRILGQYPPGEVVYWKKGRQVEKLKKIKYVDALRDRLATLLAARKEGLNIDAEWDLVKQAEKMRLPNMARLLAYHVLTRDQEHLQAHLFLGHKKRNKAWLWQLDGKDYKFKKFNERILNFKTGLILNSEHYTIRSNVGLRKSIDAIIDLERLYVGWMKLLGEPLEAGEDVLERDPSRMQVYLFRSPDDKGCVQFRSQEHEPMYDATKQFATKKGGHNLLITFLDKKGGRPIKLFDLGARQLLYSLTVINSIKGDVADSSDNTYAHWAEWGIGYWIERQTTGNPGYLSWIPFSIEPSVAKLALVQLKRGPLSKNWVRDEITNLIGLETKLFYASGKQTPFYRAKSQAFASFLLEKNVEVLFRKKVKGHSTDGFYFYLREAYGTPTGGSSSKFDKGLGGGGAKVESLTPAWRAWLREAK